MDRLLRGDAARPPRHRHRPRRLPLRPRPRPPPRRDPRPIQIRF